MKEHPIIFSAPMVRALLDGRKTQTRRLASSPLRVVQARDKLWVREAFHATEGFTREGGLFGYQVPGRDREFDVPGVGHVREFRHHLDGWGGTVSRNYPSIHMPRWAARITLRVNDVRIEPLQSISHEDSVAEGLELLTGQGPNFYSVELPNGWHFSQPTARPCFEMLWRELHGRKAWDSNPDVVVLTFSIETLE